MFKSRTLSKVKNIEHVFFGRNGGVSKGIYSSLNCGPGSSDKPEDVKKNREIVLKELSLSDRKLCTLYQCHSNKVVTVKKTETCNQKTEADALVTNSKEIVLGILTADCAPVLFFDEHSAIIGAAHAGWKGALYGILENTVAAMREFGSLNQNIVAAIGPCIGPESYEVSEDFRKKFLREDDSSYDFFKMIAKQNHYLFNLPGYAEHRLRTLGLKSIEWIGLDTLSDEKNFFSYRRSCQRNEQDYGRQVSIIALT